MKLIAVFVAERVSLSEFGILRLLRSLAGILRPGNITIMILAQFACPPAIGMGGNPAGAVHDFGKLDGPAAMAADDLGIRASRLILAF